MPSDSPSRAKIFLEASKNLRQDFERVKNLPHHGEKGREAENILKIFLKEHLPKRFDVASGFILDQSDQVSSQTDIIVYDANSCPLLETYENNLIIPADNAAAIVEVKSNLTAADIQDAADKIAKIKSLKKSAIDLPLGPWNINTVGIVFAFKSTLSIESVGSHYHKAIAEKGIGRHIDYIFILDDGMLTLIAHIPGEKGFAPILMYHPNSGTNGTVLVLGGTKFKEKTLDQFLRFLIAHLHFFWPHITHPGFDMSPSDNATGERVFGTFLTVKTNETDPQKKKAIHDEYLKKFQEGKLD